ncbi:MAG TPA: PAS domain S-box protein [Candidatus Acidoferrum sp.]|nr:PAS domain S-box protein [Candidatus Acidoferrum sp.]
MASAAPSIPPAQQVPSPQTFKTALVVLFILTAAIWLSSRSLLASNFLLHWYCFVGNKRLLWTTVIADLLIGLSYVAISATLATLARRAGRNLPYAGFFWAFGLFIVSCGATHFLEVVTVWKPVYWLAAATKAVTAIVSAGTALVLLIAVEDIVDFVHTAREAVTRRGYERFRALVEAAPMAVVSSDLEGKITTWNPTAEHLFGWSATEVVGKSVPLIPPEKVGEYDELHLKTIAGEITKGLETLRFNSKGKRIPVSISTAPVSDEHGSLTGTIAVIEDISERKRIELELREKSEVLSTVTQALNVYLETGEWNSASRQLLSFVMRQTQSEFGFLGVVLDGPVLRILAHEGFVWDAKINREYYEEAMRRYESEGYLEFLDLHNLFGYVITKGQTVISNRPGEDSRSGGLPAGHPALNSFLGVPIFKGAQVTGLIGVANRPGGYTGQEIRSLETMSQTTGVLYENYRQSLKRTALEEQQKQLEQQVRQSQKMEVLGRLAGGVAHDFNNMLMVISGCSELLERSLPVETPARIYLDQIHRTSQKAAAITKQLLAFSRRQVLEFRPVDLHEALTESEFMLPRLLGSDIQLSFRHEATKSWILSDPAQIEQVVANLAINARDAMPEGGRLSISTRNATQVPANGVEQASQTADWVVLEVKDTGGGMDEKTRTQIFEPFFTTKPAGKGTGLGLATVYGIVKQSSGHIRVESTPGAGTCFEVYFPVVARQEEEVQQVSLPAGVLEEPGGGITVLVADDEAALRHTIVEILRSSGYNVLEAQTAEEALEITRQNVGKIDILLTDVIMPGLRGPELARQVKNIQPDAQVVFMSGYAEGLPEAELPPNSAFLQKPFRFATLLEQLKLIRRRA